jgi:glycosyltransferase involved in cell wall biosynthesis
MITSAPLKNSPLIVQIFCQSEKGLNSHLNLFLFTASYPYDSAAEQTFLSDEVAYLKKEFDRVILVPRDCTGKRLPLSDGIEVDESYSSFLALNRVKALSTAIFSLHFFADIFSRPSILFNKDALQRLIKFVGKADLTRQWVERWFQNSSANPRDCIFYTFWFDDSSMGIGLAKNTLPDVRVVSRAHGYDLYEERYKFAYWPRRSTALSLMDGFFPDSETGLRYMQSRYPQYQTKYQTALLGVMPSGFITKPSQDGKLRIVSCSRIVPVKRVDLLLEGIVSASRLRPDIHIEWHHFGDGESRAELQERANKTFPENAKAVFHGYTTQLDLFDFYREYPLEVFVNVSESEGTPVAIMEAISCGIPILATAVGGNVEIAAEQNGVLLSPNPQPEEIAAALIGIHDNVEDTAKKRTGSFQVWQEKYNAERNFQEFAVLLKQVRSA